MIGKDGHGAIITEEEAELYDRQIRLWGLDSQKRLRQARVLISGLRDLGCEVAKNVILSGVRSLTLMDNSSVTKDDITTSFTLSECDLEKNRAVAVLPKIQKLNPMVDTKSNTADVCEKDEEFFKQFDVVCALRCSQEAAVKINKICNDNKIHFITGDCFGFYGFAFFDFGVHEYSEQITHHKQKVEEPNGEPAMKRLKMEHEEDENVTIKRTIIFTRLLNALSGKDTAKKSAGLFDLIKTIWHFKDTQQCLPEVTMSEEKQESLSSLLSELDDSLRSKPNLSLDNILNHTSGEFVSTCAIVGGIIGQEIIKAVSQKDAPLNNFFLFDGTEGSGYVQQLGCVDTSVTR